MGNYGQLSRLMSDHPELLILRKYTDLNVKNLLYYQAELAHLELELQEVEWRTEIVDPYPGTVLQQAGKLSAPNLDTLPWWRLMLDLVNLGKTCNGRSSVAFDQS